MVDQTLPLANDLDLIFIYRNGHFAGIYNHFIWPRPIDNGKKGVHFTLHVGVKMGNINGETPELSTVEFLHPELMLLSAVVFQHSRNNGTIHSSIVTSRNVRVLLTVQHHYQH